MGEKENKKKKTSSIYGSALQVPPWNMNPIHAKMARLADAPVWWDRVCKIFSVQVNTTMRMRPTHAEMAVGSRAMS